MQTARELIPPPDVLYPKIREARKQLYQLTKLAKLSAELHWPEPEEKGKATDGDSQPVTAAAIGGAQ